MTKFPAPLHPGTLAKWPTPAQAEEMERLRAEFDEIHARLGSMHGYANGLSQACRANRHEECPGTGCVCACHGEDE